MTSLSRRKHPTTVRTIQGAATRPDWKEVTLSACRRWGLGASLPASLFLASTLVPASQILGQSWSPVPYSSTITSQPSQAAVQPTATPAAPSTQNSLTQAQQFPAQAAQGAVVLRWKKSSLAAPLPSPAASAPSLRSSLPSPGTTAAQAPVTPHRIPGNPLRRRIEMTVPGDPAVVTASHQELVQDSNSKQQTATSPRSSTTTAAVFDTLPQDSSGGPASAPSRSLLIQDVPTPPDSVPPALLPEAASREAGNSLQTLPSNEAAPLTLPPAATAPSNLVPPELPLVAPSLPPSVPPPSFGTGPENLPALPQPPADSGRSLLPETPIEPTPGSVLPLPALPNTPGQLPETIPQAPFRQPSLQLPQQLPETPVERQDDRAPSPFQDATPGDSSKSQDSSSKESPFRKPLDVERSSKEPQPENCDPSREKARSSQIETISLDVSPSFAVGVNDRGSEETKRKAFAEKAPLRPWNDHTGQFIVDAKLIDLEHDAAVVQTASGRTQQIPLSRLSDPDLVYVSEAWGLPVRCGIHATPDAPRSFIPATVQWKASGICHHPLYFEELQLERYGHEVGPVLQPVLSSAVFFGNVLMLPYHVGMNPPWECQYALGHERPGNCMPWTMETIPYSEPGTFLQAAAITSAVFILP